MQSCPQEYYDGLLCPLLGPLFTYMLQVVFNVTIKSCIIYSVKFKFAAEFLWPASVSIRRDLTSSGRSSTRGRLSSKLLTINMQSFHMPATV